MTPSKRRPATPAGQGPTRATPKPEVPIAADPPPVPPPPDAPVPDELVTAPVAPAETKDSTQEAPTGDASGDSAPPTETGQVDPEDRATTQSPGRSRALHPERVWPD